jgi:hypothetical protein
MANATLTKDAKFADEDVGNIILMEHVNVQIDDQAKATLFYLVGLGFTRDPHMMVGLTNMWVNLGEQQFHLPTREPQVLRGHIGVVVPNLDALADRLKSIEPELAGTKFDWHREEGFIAATCPWGNSFRLYQASGDFGGIQTGIPYVAFDAPRGTAEGIVRFYEEILGAPAHVEEQAGSKAAVVDIGRYQNLVFRETDDVPDYDGHHIAVYITDFSSVYAKLAERGLVTEEPANHQLRFVDIIDPRDGRKLFQIEHEVRSMRHLLYARPLVNRQIGQFQEPTRVNGQTVLGRVM